MKRHSCYYCHDYVYGFEPHRIIFIVDEFQAGQWPVHESCLRDAAPEPSYRPLFALKST